MRHYSLLVLASILLLFAAQDSLAGAPAPPDSILYNGKIFTAERNGRFVTALAIQNARIVAAGDSKRILTLAGPNTRRIDLGGRTVIPGLNDAHNHMQVRPASTVELQLPGPDPTWPEVQKAVAAVDLTGLQDPILAGTIGAKIFSDPRIDRAALDRLSPAHVLILTTFTGHGAILNSRALVKVDIQENIQDPMGARFERDAQGRLDGVLREYATLYLFRKLGNLASDEDAIGELRSTLVDSAQHGITTLQVMSEKITPNRYVDLLQRVPTAIRIRLIRMPGTTTTGRDVAEGISLPRNPAPLISVSGSKWLLDGVPFEGTFAPRQAKSSPAPGAPAAFFSTLPMTFSPAEIDRMLQETLRSGDQLIVHVSGYPAAVAMLDAMESAGGKAVWGGRRVRFEHGDGLLPNLIARVKAMGIVVVEQGTHLDNTMTGPDTIPWIRAEKSQPLRTLLDAGVPLVLSSDEDGASNPFLEIMLACLDPNRPAEALTREQAVIAYTLTAAYAEFTDKDKGSLSAGKLADLAVLSQDIFAVPLEQLPSTKSVLTMVGGTVIYDAHVLRL